MATNQAEQIIDKGQEMKAPLGPIENAASMLQKYPDGRNQQEIQPRNTWKVRKADSVQYDCLVSIYLSIYLSSYLPPCLPTYLAS